VTLPVDALKPGQYKAYFYDHNDYNLVDPIDVLFNSLGSVQFAVRNFSTHNARQGDHFEARVGGLLSRSCDASNTFHIISSENANWATISSADGVIRGIPDRQGDAVVTVKALACNGTKTDQLSVRIPVRPKGAQLVNQLNVLSFNMWYGGTAVSDYHDKQIRFLTTTGADVVGLQESRKGHARRLAYALGWYFWDISDIGIISRYPFTQRSSSAGGLNLGARLSIGISLSTDKKTDIIMWNTHLGYSRYGPYDFCLRGMSPCKVMDNEEISGRTTQIKEIVQAMVEDQKENPNIPLLLTGDFNAPSHLDWTEGTRALHCGIGRFDWPSSSEPQRAGLLDSYRVAHPDPSSAPGITWSPICKCYSEYCECSGAKTKMEPMDRVDFIYFKGPLDVLSSETVVVGEPRCEPNHWENEWTSDHAAVKTVFKVGKTSQGQRMDL
jgi:endonuclease/exonuclease/phosphatase family metal-dependent hydrolase